MMESSQFTNQQPSFEAMEQITSPGATCDTFIVKLYGKLHFLKRLKPQYANDIRYQEAFRKEFETGYRLEHLHLVRYISLSDDGILMEYVDGETLSQRLSRDPDYFENRSNSDKFVHQLLDAVAYLHSHQILHLDLKPDNILFTRINDDVKLIDLGCCRTDTFVDTPGCTNRYAAPEQLSGGEVDARTDIYAIGKIIEQLPNHSIYNKVIARCTAENPQSRYQTVAEILCDVNQRWRYYRYVAAFVTVVVVLAVGYTLLPHREQATPVIQAASVDSVVQKQRDSVKEIEENSLDSARENPAPVLIVPPQPPKKSEQALLKEDTDRLMDEAYCATVATFCDSVFPPRVPSSGEAWTDASTAFHDQTILIGNRLAKKYPNIPESTIRQDCEARFQVLVASVFNQMRINAQQ